MTDPKTVALIVAGGKGTRARTGGRPKQYWPLAGQPVLRRTVHAFARHPKVDAVLVVISPENEDLYKTAVADLPNLLPPAHGGETRQASVKAGLAALARGDGAPQRVLIHDGARPFVRRETIDAVIDALFLAEGAIAALPVTDTLKRQNESQGIEATVDREGLWRAQTPQGFRFETIHRIHSAVDDGVATDDASLLEAEGIHVALVNDHPTNMKLTYREDFDVAETLMASLSETRTGFGFDVHAFEEGDAVIIGGVTIPHTHKLKGHSDADVGLHALCDALFGALADGDIGQHFPPSEEKWRGAPSSQFLEYARARVEARGGTIVHVDLTILAEAPKVGPHRDAMREQIAEILKIDIGRVAVKATTTEKLGFTGRQEGIAAQAVATLRVPPEGL